MRKKGDKVPDKKKWPKKIKFLIGFFLYFFSFQAAIIP
jgi:hypothetical protein